MRYHRRPRISWTQYRRIAQTAVDLSTLAADTSTKTLKTMLLLVFLISFLAIAIAYPHRLFPFQKMPDQIATSLVTTEAGID
jgi:hypothetical protein